MNLLASLVLIEANVYNINQPYNNNVSVTQYVTKLLHAIPADATKAQLIKKLTKLITNDDTVLTPITELPDDAPEWAKAAAYAGDLKAFVPTDDVNDKLTHISHYIKAAADDTKSDNKDIAAHAVRELGGLVKVETLTVLYTKANEYFARGTRKASRRVDGMEYVMTTDNFDWYVLTTQEAMAREGKTLQNCIGQIYTLERCQRDKTKIFIMRDHSGNSCVAMRVSFDHPPARVQEFKGKNNRPPVPKYMPAVVEFVTKSKFAPTGGSASSDFMNAGYYVSPEGTIIPVSEAMVKFTKRTVIGKSESGKDVVAVTGIDDSLFVQLIKSVRNDAYAWSAPQAHYQLLDGTKILATATCQQSKDTVSDIWTPDGSPSGVARELMSVLASKNVISGVSGDLKKSLPLIHSMKYTKGVGIEPVTPNATETIDVGGGNKTSMLSYTGEDAAAIGSVLVKSIDGENPATPNSVYIVPIAAEVRQHMARTVTAYVITEEGMVVPVALNNRGMPFPSDQHNDNTPLDNVTRDLAVRLANETESDLPLGYCARAGIVNNEGEYSKIQLDPIAVTQNASMFDLSDMSESSKCIAASLLIHAKKANNRWSYAPTRSFSYTAKSPYREYNNIVTPSYSGGMLYPPDKHVAASWMKLKNAAFDGQSPDAFIVPSTSQTVPYIISLVGKTATNIDVFGMIRGQLSGSERAGLGRIIQHVNELVDAGAVTLTRESIRGLPSIVKFDRSTGKLVSGVDKMASKMESSHDSYEMTFDDGTKIKRMVPKDFVTWQETLDASSLTGCEFYELLSPDDDRLAVICVKPKSNSIYKVYTKRAADGEEAPVNSTRFPVANAKYINAFAKQNNITKFPSDTMLTEKSSIRKMLSALYSMSGETKRGRVCRAAGLGTYFHLSNWTSAGYTFNDVYPDRWLAKYGLATSRYDDNTGTAYVGPTAAGKAAYRKILDGDVTSMYQLVNSVNGTVSRKDPTPPPVAPRAEPGEPRERAPRAADGQTKAARAMARFRELTAQNNGTIPARGEFIRILLAEPFNMTPAGASTYYHNLKVKYAQEQGQLGERFTFSEYLMVIAD